MEQWNDLHDLEHQYVGGTEYLAGKTVVRIENEVSVRNDV